jgi:hypothetical protein
VVEPAGCNLDHVVRCPNPSGQPPRPNVGNDMEQVPRSVEKDHVEGVGHPEGVDLTRTADEKSLTWSQGRPSDESHRSPEWTPSRCHADLTAYVDGHVG